jgi:outer membrane protein assembly factor BamB
MRSQGPRLLACLASTLVLGGVAYAQVASGKYTGNGVAGRAVWVGFQPDVVLVKRIGVDPQSYAVLRTSTMTGDSTKSLHDNPGAALGPNLVQMLVASGFRVGTDMTVNELGAEYHWVAFRATAGTLKVGTYTGDGNSNQSITGVGFQPDLLFVLPPGSGTDGMPLLVSSTFPADIAFDFDSSLRAPNTIQALQADGFLVGTGGVSPARPNLNANSVTFHYIAWRAVPGQMAVGTYVGNGLDDRNLDIVGFSPEGVLVKKFPNGSIERSWSNKPASTGVGVDASFRFADSPGALFNNAIQALRPNGFQVGSHDRVNSALDCGGPCTYHWIAFGPNVPRVNHRSIGTAPDYSNGTVTTTAFSSTVTGSLTSWVTANRGPGDRIWLGGQDYTVASVDSEIQLTLTEGYTGTPGSGQPYVLSRQFPTIRAWEDCISFAGPCTYFPVTTANFFNDDRSEAGVLYKDSVFALPTDVEIDGSITDSSHTITLTAAPRNRHNGIAGAGVVIDGQNGPTGIRVLDDYVTLEWLEVVGVRGGGSPQAAIKIVGTGGPTGVLIQNVLIHDFYDPASIESIAGIRLSGAPPKNVTIRNCMIWDGDEYGIEGDDAGDVVTIENCSIDDIRDVGSEGVDPKSSSFTVRNTIVTGSSSTDFEGSYGPASSNNISSDSSAPGPGSQSSVSPNAVFVTPGANLHLRPVANAAVDSGVDLSVSFTRDIDDTPRTNPWDVGADDVGPVPSQIHYRSIGTALAYSTGSVSAINGSTTVYGNGTSFVTANRGRGDRIDLDGIDYVVLDVVSESELVLTTPFLGGTGSGKTYVISRQFSALSNWEACIRGGFCSVLPVASSNLVADDRKEVGIVYDDGSSYGPVVIDGAITDATHDIVLTADGRNRHTGVAGSGAVIDPGGTSGPGILVGDDYVTIEWMEIHNSSDNGILVTGLTPSNHVVIRNNLVHDLPATGIRVNDPVATIDIYNNVVYGVNRGVYFDVSPAEADVASNTVVNCFVTGYAGAGGPFGMVTLRNNVGRTGSSDFSFPGGVNASSGYNLSGNGSAPGGNSLTGVPLPNLNFVSTTPGAEDLHIQSPSAAENVGKVLGKFNTDIDGAPRVVPWDIGADEAGWPPPFRIHYRSIGTNPGVLASSGTASAAASSTTVAFSSPLPADVGMGDELVLDPAGANEIAHILTRISSTQVTVQAPLASAHPSVSYIVRRAFQTLQGWEDARGGDLVSGNRREVGVAYNDGPFNVGVSISGSTTDSSRYMTLTVARPHRHFGIPGVGARIDANLTPAGEVLVDVDHTQVEWLEVTRVVGTAVRVRASGVRLGQLLVHGSDDGVRLSGGGGHSFTIRNSIVYGNTGDGIEGDEVTDSIVVENCTVYGNGGDGLDETTGTPFTVTNTISMNNGSDDFAIPGGIQSYTISSDGTGSLTGRTATTLINPGPGDWVVFNDPVGGDFHLRASPENDAVDAGTNLPVSVASDVDEQPRPSGNFWDIGADELGSFSGAPLLSSLNDQTFLVASTASPAAALTILDDGVAPAITASKDIRIRIPAGFPMRWDPAATALFLSGPASFKVDSVVKAFEDSGRTVVLDVLADFAPSDEVTVGGLGFWSFTAPSPSSYLELEVGNDNLVSALDDQTITVLPGANPSLSSYDSQVFTELQPPAPASPMSITEGTSPAINTTDDIKIRIPAGLAMTWDPSFTSIVVSGPGASNVDTTVSYEDSDRTLRIHVLIPFPPGEYVVVTGPVFRDFVGPPFTDHLVLDVGVTALDDKTLTISGAADVRFFTATATDSQVTLEWLTPVAGMCDSIVIRGRADGINPANPTDGYPVANVSPCTLDTRYSATDPTAPLVNDNLYAYAAFVEYGVSSTSGKFVKTRPMNSVATAVRWAYSTGATTMAPSGLRFQSGQSYVYTVSNDSILHAMRGGSAASAGTWPPNWKPFPFGAPAQSRPIPYPYAVGAAANGAVFVGSQDGNVYAIDAATGSEIWKEPISTMVQASPAGHFQAFHPSGLDVIVTGTRDSGAPNELEALDKDTGAPVWSFDNSPAQLGDGTEIGIISGGATIDYLGGRIYFASRQGTGGMGSTSTLWCVDISSGSPQLLWAKSVGNVDGSPILYQGVVYVGTNAGVVYAADAATGSVNWSLPLGDGPIKGFLFPQFGTTNLFAATSNNVWSISDDGLSASLNWQVGGADIPSPSTPLSIPGTTKVIVGSGDGHLYQLDTLAPVPPTRVRLGIGASGVGAPTMDILNLMIYVGTEEGVVYGVSFPIP